MAAGMTQMKRHDFSEFPSKTFVKAGNKMDPINSCVHAPPKLPHPPTSPLAVPATSRVNIRVGQNCAMTKDPPAIPIKKRSVMRPPAVLTSPVKAHGMDANIKTADMGMRAPNLSQTVKK